MAIGTHSMTSSRICLQVDIHAPWGGVVPNLASEAHKQAMEGTIQEALSQAGLEMAQLDAVAVTIGPGLSLCLKVPTHTQGAI
jgi:N6-L-threonylcarbamoyladenine synthase